MFTLKFTIKAIVTEAEGTIKVNGLPKGPGLDKQADMTGATCSGNINLVVQALHRGQCRNL